MLSGSDAPVQPGAEAHALAESLGYPVIVKASMGGGGRGMRVVESADALDAALDQARREAGTAFGVPDVFIEKFLRRAKHIEVQLLGDRHGNLVHLYERDCSVQRRHQKIVEIAPAPNLDPAIRAGDLRRRRRGSAATSATRTPGPSSSCSTSTPAQFYFIEVNPRIQVEHTVTEIVTGIDLVKSQILIAGGEPLSDPEIDLPDQTAVQVQGFALQCRVTTEDPENQFTPDYGRITHYRSVGGLGIRTDGGPAITGGIITPFYDSLLVKISAYGRRFIDAARRQERALQEFRVRGVKTNVPFLLNVVDASRPSSPGDCTTRFLDETPELFRFPVRQDRATQLLTLRGRGHGQRLPRRDAPGRLRGAARARAAAVRPARRPAAGLAPAVPGDGAGRLLPMGPRAAAAAS